MRISARLFLLSIAAISFGATPNRAVASPVEISFTVQKLIEENVEGPDVERSFFTAGNKRIIFGQPKDCTINTHTDGLVILLSKAGLDGEIHVSRSPFSPELDLAKNALQYRDAAAAAMPAGATAVEADPPLANTYPYNGWKSVGFTWKFSLYGRPMVRSVSYINLEVGAQVVVTTLANQRDDQKVREIAQQFMSSWWVKER